MKQRWSTFIVFGLSQSVSQLGSAATSFALIAWMYQQNGSALSVSVMTFCTYLPFVLVSVLAGSFVDRHSKRAGVNTPFPTRRTAHANRCIGFVCTYVWNISRYRSRRSS